MPEPSQTTADAKLINGSDIALFVGGKMMLGAKSHKRQVKTTTTVITDKDTDDSLYDKKVVKKVEVTISCDGFIKTTDTTIDALETAIMEGKVVTLKYGYKDGKGGSEPSFTEGEFVVMSFDRTDPASDNSTYSATFVNNGKPKTKGK